MITLKVSCSMCGKELPSELPIEKADELTLQELKRRMRWYNWIVQVNGEIIDTYCGKVCAR